MQPVAQAFHVRKLLIRLDPAVRSPLVGLPGIVDVHVGIAIIGKTPVDEGGRRSHHLFLRNAQGPAVPAVPAHGRGQGDLVAHLAGFLLVADEERAAVHHQEQRPFRVGIVPDRRVNVHFQGDRLRDPAVEQQFEGGFLVPDGGMGVISRSGGVGNILFHLHLIGRRSKGKGHGNEQGEQAHRQKDSASRRPNRVVFSIFSSSSSGVA